MSDEPVFEISLACGNCGREWAEQFEARVEVTERIGSLLGRIWIHPDDCRTPYLGFGECMGRYVECPTCERSAEVRILARRPLVTAADGLPVPVQGHSGVCCCLSHAPQEAACDACPVHALHSWTQTATQR